MPWAKFDPSPDTAVGVACDGCPSLPDLLKWYEAAGGLYYVCPVCFNAKKLEEANLINGAEVQGTIRCGPGSATRARRRSVTDRRYAAVGRRNWLVKWRG
jgi:hypothetical protein